MMMLLTRRTLTAGWTARNLLPFQLNKSYFFGQHQHGHFIVQQSDVKRDYLAIFHALSKNDVSSEDDDEDTPAPGKPLRVERLLANLGYGKRKECQQFVQKGRALKKDGKKLKVGDKVLHSDIMMDGEELDAPFPMTIMINKPVGYVVTAPDDDKILDPKVYDLLPYRFGRRRPFLSSVGRLDKATCGMLLLTDDGQLVHRINTPKKGIWKVYEARLAAPMTEKEVEAAVKKFASGTFLLQGEYEPLLPAKLVALNPDHMRISICEGRYHQVRRMFTAIGHEVVSLIRLSVGGLDMGDLPDGEWRYLSAAELDTVFSGPSSEQVLSGSMNKSSDNMTLSSTSAPTKVAPPPQLHSLAPTVNKPDALEIVQTPSIKKVRLDLKRRVRVESLRKEIQRMPE
ncbi:hypothetical protein CEUSTIGMA_g2894.t1 [Chlamydomonas eustigma]|uniref:Pseudouridine synthase RsuA/RluA-like domain-containing protein n=1 Tax=Chlamydomonas eustigma TaxID=1157962 RepID=A0A250WY56_9CHLO|nr:hypothetical protein CEUSTIGMA_g2894.t1 [Chlamydomonas eustigma]|eukprot:GAX75450.1 hypothetical protein CEUSTIGMA_g2894.t1 [Chlamydomonas eustigma]